MSANWRLRAACISEPPALFFAAEDETQLRRRLRESMARQVCAGCPVRRACLNFRLSFPCQRDDAIWAGYDQDERRALRHALLKREQRRTEEAA